MGICIGIDPSFTSTGFAVLNDDNPVLVFRIAHKWDKKKGSVFSVQSVSNFTEFGYKSPPPLVESDVSTSVVVIQNYLFILDVLCSVYKWVQKNFKVKKYPISVGIELPMGSHGGNAVSIQRVFASFLIAFYTLSDQFSVESFKPTEIKKYIIGGRAKKSLIIKKLWQKFKIDIDDEDIADAVAVALLRNRS